MDRRGGKVELCPYAITRSVHRHCALRSGKEKGRGCCEGRGEKNTRNARGERSCASVVRGVCYLRYNKPVLDEFLNYSENRNKNFWQRLKIVSRRLVLEWQALENGTSSRVQACWEMLLKVAGNIDVPTVLGARPLAVGMVTLPKSRGTPSGGGVRYLSCMH